MRPLARDGWPVGCVQMPPADLRQRVGTALLRGPKVHPSTDVRVNHRSHCRVNDLACFWIQLPTRSPGTGRSPREREAPPLMESSVELAGCFIDLATPLSRRRRKLLYG